MNAQKVIELVGCITDSRIKEPLEGVMVHIQNTGVWSISDENGCYTIDKLEEVIKFQLPDTEINRSFVKISKTKETAKKYPRKAGLPTKEPLL